MPKNGFPSGFGKYKSYHNHYNLKDTQTSCEKLTIKRMVYLIVKRKDMKEKKKLFNYTYIKHDLLLIPL